LAPGEKNVRYMIFFLQGAPGKRLINSWLNRKTEIKMLLHWNRNGSVKEKISAGKKRDPKVEGTKIQRRREGKRGQRERSFVIFVVYK